MLAFILWLLVIGLIAGAVARLLVPGRDPMGVAGTIALGVVGSFVGGFLGDVFLRSEGEDIDGLNAAGLIGSIIGAVVVLLLYRWFVRGRGRTGVRL
jgi:uncharacterized membrane protein YeaQ/YmgE (transglycosylase-associated protein family)